MLADNAVDSSKIQNGSIGSADLANGSVTGNQIADGSVSSADILDGTVNTADIADGAVGSADIADGAVKSGDISDGEVKSQDIADSEVKSADIGDGQVGASEIADGSVGTTDLDSGLTTALQSLNIDADPISTAGNTREYPVRGPFAGGVSVVTYTPLSNITGQNTNTRKLELINKGQSGSGSTVIATIQFDAGVDATAFDEKTIAITTANAIVAAGDILDFKSSAVGSGLADPGGLVHIEITKF